MKNSRRASIRTIGVRVHPNAKHPSVIPIDSETYSVNIDAPARDGEANERLVEIMAEYLDVPKSRIVVTRGFRGHTKFLRIE